MYIEWLNEKRELANCEELSIAIEELIQISQVKNTSFIANFIREGEEIMSIGISHGQSTLSYLGRHGNPPYYSSFNGLNGDETSWFEFFGQATEVRNSTLVSMTSAKSALHTFCCTGERDGAIMWKED